MARLRLSGLPRSGLVQRRFSSICGGIRAAGRARDPGGFMPIDRLPPSYLVGGEEADA